VKWKFGDAPLDETTRFAAVARRITGLLLQMEHESPEAAALIASLEEAETRLAKLVPNDPRPRVGPALEGAGRVYLDHSRDIGDYNPAFPLYTLALEDEGQRARGTVRFPLIYEGPPGIVHGGFIALFFDQVMQHHSCDVGQAGKTTRLEVRYRAPTPLDEDLHYEVVRSLDDRRIVSTASLRDGETECASATMRAVPGDLSALPPFAARKAR